MHDTKLTRGSITTAELFKSVGGLAEAKRRIRLLRERKPGLPVASLKPTGQD